MANKIERAIAGQLEIPKGFGTALKAKGKPDTPVIIGGFDIEADAETASPYLITYCIGEKNAHKEVFSKACFFEFFTRYWFRDSINFFHNIQYDFEGLLKLFPEEVSLLIYGNGIVYFNKSGEVCPAQEYHYKLHYIPQKAFHIKIKGGHKYSYFDSLQYFNMGLAAASKKFLGNNKGDFDAKASIKNLFRLKTTIDYEIRRLEEKQKFCVSNADLVEINEKIAVLKTFDSAKDYRACLLEYAILDAKLCRDLGELIVNGVHQFAYTKNFNSTASISEYYFRSNGLTIPKLSNWRYKEFMRSYYGGRFEITKKGYLDNVNFYDIKSAYPAAMSEMPIISSKPIVRSVYSLNDNALYGAYRINCTIPDWYISPLPVRENVVMFPTGKFTDYWVDKCTLEMLQNFGIDYKITKGVEIQDKDHSFILNPLIKTCYDIKEDKAGQPEPVRLAAKINMNSLYGKFIQVINDTELQLIESLDEMEKTGSGSLFHIGEDSYRRVHTTKFKVGKLFAPFYAAHITAHTRRQLFETAHKIGFENVIGFHTDSIILQDKTIPEENRLGGWEAESLNAQINLLKTGMYECFSNGQSKIRARGVGRQDTILKDSFSVKRRYGLNQAVRKNFDSMNIISHSELANNLNTDQKRNWTEQITVSDIQNQVCISSTPKKI